MIAFRPTTIDKHHVHSKWPLRNPVCSTAAVVFDLQLFNVRLFCFDIKLTSNVGLAIGINKGHKVTPRQKASRISNRKGAASARTTFVRDIISEVAGLAPYERRVIELIRNSQEKRARKLSKKKVCFLLLEYLKKFLTNFSSSELLAVLRLRSSP